MPSTSSLTSVEKALIKKHAPSSSSSDKILTAAIGRVYYSWPDPTKWSFSGIAGAVVFGWGTRGGWIKVVDLAGTRGVIWEHTIEEDMSYWQDRTFFHSFPGDECMIGIAFASEDEAKELYKKVSQRHKFAKKYGGTSAASFSKSSGGGGTSSPRKSRMGSKKSSSGGGVTKAMISAPSGFSHVAHMGFDSQSGGFTSNNIDPAWERLLGQLESQGVSRSQIQKNEQFIRNFVEGQGGPDAATNNAPRNMPPPPPPPPPAGAARSPPPPPHAAPTPPPAPPSSRKVPPPAPPSRTAGTSKRKPPPAPPSRRPPPSINDAGPPPPPARAPAGAPPAPPPPPPRAGGAPPAPPPPPPGRPGAPPAAPPPPPAPGAPAPPPAPAAPAPQSGRANLLADIQGKSIANLRKTDSNADARSLPMGGAVVGGAAGGAAAGAAMSAGTGADDDGGAAGGGDIASALAAALSQRKGNMGDSDDESGDDSDWD